MDTIKSYLENIFLSFPNSDRVIKAKEELLQMMEDKYYELKSEGKTENEAIGTVISEFGNLQELADELGIEDDMYYEKEKVLDKIIKMDEAKEYIQISRKLAKWLSLAVMLCIYSPIMLILLLGNDEKSSSNENLFGFFGLFWLIIFIALAVGLFIFIGMKMNKYEYLKTEVFKIDQVTQNMLEQMETERKNSIVSRLIFGVITCILSVIPMFYAVFLSNTSLDITIGLCILLFIVGIGVFLIVSSATEESSFKIILQKDEYSMKKKSNKIFEAISGCYWTLIVTIYLIWSFSTMRWEYTWIIWPITGVIYGAISSIVYSSDRK